ncbi:MAG: Rrf2 family transcriptional regulator [Elusimicrobiales bacterium]|nr:Rrf2 family transcriptional regulator [Elusimicrobiales bacterium]
MISTRGRYAIRMMIDLAENQHRGFVPLKDIAERQGISKKYLEQIIPVLNRAGILSACRGAGGGYKLAKQPAEYTVADILKATEGHLAPVSCLEGESNTCPQCPECATLFIWTGLQKIEHDYLSGITLQDILDRKAASAGNNYSI